MDEGSSNYLFLFMTLYMMLEVPSQLATLHIKRDGNTVGKKSWMAEMTFLLVGLTSESNIVTKQKCNNQPSQFCYACGKVTMPQRELKITSFMRKMNPVYFGVEIGDQGKHYVQGIWEVRLVMTPDSPNVRSQIIIGHKKITLPTLHIKLSFMRTFIKATCKLKTKFFMVFSS